ncbi:MULTISPECIES: CRISPR-associated endonuclease Cas1 [unclassified Listeria]|uniref:CRISPR-associated endonuclease Cas1 n=1 Tax=unclassified Listeria TaxID=2642072 RepID=UPI0026F432A2|nr:MULTISPECIES: CRISPR-associated endonuclease Cas1 [unclassified Listeria]
MTRDIYLFGEVTTNTKCLNYLAEKKIPVHIFNYYGFTLEHIIGDRLIFSLLNKNTITEGDFEEKANFYYIKPSGQKKVLQAYDERLKETLRHRDLKRNVSYRRLIRLECYKIVKTLMEDEPYQGFKMWW